MNQVKYNSTGHTGGATGERPRFQAKKFQPPLLDDLPSPHLLQLVSHHVEHRLRSGRPYVFLLQQHCSCGVHMQVQKPKQLAG
jgi:hypothetical protein